MLVSPPLAALPLYSVLYVPRLTLTDLAVCRFALRLAGEGNLLAAHVQSMSAGKTPGMALLYNPLDKICHEPGDHLSKQNVTDYSQEVASPVE